MAIDTKKQLSVTLSWEDWVSISGLLAAPLYALGETDPKRSEKMLAAFLEINKVADEYVKGQLRA